MNEKLKVGDLVKPTKAEFVAWLERSGLSTIGTIIRIDKIWLNSGVYTVKFPDQPIPLHYSSEEIERVNK
jgi:hypothetical protein